MEIKRYWEAPCPTPFDERPDNEWIAECRSRLEQVVGMRLMSDVPLGMFLSGGVDSSAIAAIIKRQANGPVKTFSVGYGEARFSELSEARQVADRIGTDHHEVRVSMQEFFNALPRLVWHEDEPITWPSSVSLYFVSKLASAGSQGGSYRRGQRRALRRIRPLPFLPAQLAMDARLSDASQGFAKGHPEWRE